MWRPPFHKCVCVCLRAIFYVQCPGQEAAVFPSLATFWGHHWRPRMPVRTCPEAWFQGYEGIPRIPLAGPLWRPPVKAVEKLFKAALTAWGITLVQASFFSGLVGCSKFFSLFFFFLNLPCYFVLEMNGEPKTEMYAPATMSGATPVTSPPRERLVRLSRVGSVWPVVQD